MSKISQLFNCRQCPDNSKVTKKTTEENKLAHNRGCGHPFPFKERGIDEADISKFVVVGFNIPACLHLDSGNVGGRLLKIGGTRIDFKHIVNPQGRCGMPTVLTGAEITDDDRGNYTYTSASICIPFYATWPSSEYVAEALRAVNAVIIAFREIAERPTIATLGLTDLSQGLTVEGPFPDSEKFVKESGVSGMFLGGVRSDGSPVLSMKGFAGGWGRLQPTRNLSTFDEIQEYLDGKKVITVARRYLQEAFRELRHGDFAFALVLAGGSLEIGSQEYLRLKSWSAGSSGSFVTKFLVAPFTANGVVGFDQFDSIAHDLVDKLYRTRNKVIHEGHPYYMDQSASPPMAVTVTSSDAHLMMSAAKVALDWLEGHS